ncbi:MAG: WYL domain-containing protein [Clostridiales bacterium]|nr:WYL domain-containing protein [Clostridiales bacterium]
MYALGSKKMLTMGILQVLKDHTDYDHRLTQQEIIDLLDREHGMVCDRKSIKSNIISLIEWGYEIENDKGWYLAERDFEEVELRMLIDSVLYAKGIPAHQAMILIEKLKGLGSKHFEDKMNHTHSVKALYHTGNKQAFTNIEIIEEAIHKNKQIEFVYNTYGTDKKMHPRREKKYIVSPYRVIISNKPYMICNTNNHDDLSNYRIDRMTEVKIIGEKSRSINEIKGMKYGFDIPKHMSEHVYMFADNVSRVKFKVKKSIMGEVVDWFGLDFVVRSETEEEAVIQVNSSEQAMVFWAMQYGEYVEVLEPENIRDRIKENIREMAEKYKV